MSDDSSDIRHFVRNRLAAVRNAAFYLQRRTEPTALWNEDPRVPQFFALITHELGEIERVLAGRPPGTPTTVRAELPTRPLGLRILVVEDHDGNRETLVALLKDEGFVVDEAASFAAACERLESAAPYDAVLLDRVLGAHDGLELVPLVRAVHAATRIVVVSGADDESVPGVDAVVGKEHGFDELHARLGELLAGA